jgi:hypothetical protein
MAINTWFTVTLGGGVAKQPDRADHKNTCGPAGADGGDCTIAFDSAKITTLTLLDSAYASARAQIAGRLGP